MQIRESFEMKCVFANTMISLSRCVYNRCLGTADVVCSHLVTEDSCDDHGDFDCEWVSNEDLEGSED